METEMEMEVEMGMEEEEEQKEQEEQEQEDEEEQEEEEEQEQEDEEEQKEEEEEEQEQEDEEEQKEEEEEEEDEDSILNPSSDPILFEHLKNFVKGVVPFVAHGDHVWEYCLTDKGNKHCGHNLSLDDLMRERDFLKHMKKFHDCTSKDMVLKQTNRIQIMIRHQETETSESTSDENQESPREDLSTLKYLVLKSIWQAEENDSQYGPKDIFVCLQKNCGRLEFSKTFNLQRKMENHLRNEHPDETFQSLNIAFTYCGSTDTEEELLSLKCIKCGCQSYLKRIHNCSNHNWDNLTENGLMCHLCENSIADQISNLKSNFDNWIANNPEFPKVCSQCPKDLNQTDHLNWVHYVIPFAQPQFNRYKYLCRACKVESIGMEQLKLHFATIEHASNMLSEK